MDLDVVITDNIDCFFTYEPEADFVGINDFNPDTKIFNSSVIKFKPDKLNQNYGHLQMIEQIFKILRPKCYI